MANKPKTKRPKTARAALLEFTRASENGSPSYHELAGAIEFLLRREAEKEREERLHARIVEDAGASRDDSYGSGE